MQFRRIAVILPQMSNWSWQVMNGIEAFAKQKRSWSLQWFPSSESALQSVAEWQPAGVLAFCESDGQARDLLAICPRMIAVKSPAELHDVSAVTVNHYAVGEMAANHFIRRGLRNFACLSLKNSVLGERRA